MKTDVSNTSPSESYKLLDVPGKNCDKQKVLTHCMIKGKECIHEPFTKFIAGILSYKRFCVMSDITGY